MSDLISRQAVIDILKKNVSKDIEEVVIMDKHIKLIESVPNAYSVDAVVAELEKLSNAEADYYYAKSNDVIDRETAIDIVKRGVVE
jgi:predicted unusual protein kinase regulating ubiquinone biosynthesis (AarF/ABC1/UbiB family)